MPDESKSLSEGCIRPFQSKSYLNCQKELIHHSIKNKIPINTPWKKLSKYHLGYWPKNNKNFKLNSKKKIENLFFQNLYKIGYRYFKIKKRANSDKFIITSFQNRYLPQNVTGKIDLKTFKISHFLANKLKTT